DEDKKRRDTKRDPENGFKSGTAGSRYRQGERCHYSTLRWLDVMRCATRAAGAICFTSLTLTRRFRITDLTSSAPRTTVPAANVLPSPPPAEHQPQPTGVPNPPSGRLAGTTPAHHASQSGATAPTQTS